MKNQTDMVSSASNAKYNKLALIAFISSIVYVIIFSSLSFNASGIFAVAFVIAQPIFVYGTIIMSIVALVQIKYTKEKGIAFAILAIVLSYFMIYIRLLFYKLFSLVSW